MAPLSILEELGRVTRSHRIPYHVLLELTYGCNLRCVMCYNPTHQAVDEMTLSEYVRLFDELAAEGTVQLTLTGGEILARRDFWEIAHAARERHFALRLFTNGVQVTPEVARGFADLAPLSVEVSLYGCTPQTHDAVTKRPGSFDRTVRGIRNLVAARAPTIVKTLLTQINKHEVDGIVTLVAELGARFRGFDPVVFETHSGDRSPLELRVPAGEVAKLLPASWIDTEDPFSGDDGPMCGAAHDFASVTPHGVVYPCLSMRFPMGNIRERPFGEIWRAPHPDVDRVRAATWNTLPVCSSCDGRSVCQRCPGLAHHEDGDVLGPSSTSCDLTFTFLDRRSKEPVSCP